MKKFLGFTLAEVLITLCIIGVVAALTIPNLITKFREKAIVSALRKFNSDLNQAILLYKSETDDAFANVTNADNNSFDDIAKHMKIANKCTRAGSKPCKTAAWLPDYNVNYFGERIPDAIFATVAKNTNDDMCYQLLNGTNFCLDVDDGEFSMTVDVNGKNAPNRIGQDIFYFVVGGNRGKDLEAGYGHYDPPANDGICIISKACNPDNIYPDKDNGAFPTAYVLKHHKLPPKFSK
ncbi:MAG: type II secretion system GspH family protein [Muribaculaceae bacterium]|nr:type II secretion system GspH family protein [Muribaculaceae bacterium]